MLLIQDGSDEAISYSWRVLVVVSGRGTAAPLFHSPRFSLVVVFFILSVSTRQSLALPSFPVLPPTL